MNEQHNRITRRIQWGAYLKRQTFIYQITGWSEGGLMVHVREESSGIESHIALQAVLEGEYQYALSRQTLLEQPKADVTPPIVGLPGHLVHKAQQMVVIVEGFESWWDEQTALGKVYDHQTAALSDYAETQGICVATFYNYRRVYRQYHGDVASITASLHRSSYGKKQLSPAQQHFLDHVILRYPSLPVSDLRRLAQSLLKRTQGLWVAPQKCDPVPEDLLAELCNPQIPFESLVNHPEKRVLLAAIRLPGKTAFYEYYRSLTAQPERGKHILDQRHGEGTWDRQLRVFDTFAHQAVEPLQYVFLDHYLLDVFVVDEVTRNRQSRLWLTLLIDTYTRGILGFALLYEAPSILSVQSALQHAIWPKTTRDERLWHAYGVPVQLSLDNAWAHHAHSLETLARDPDLQMDLVYRPIYQGRYGALVERYFGNLAGRIQQRLKEAGGIAASNTKAVRNAAARACLLYEDLYRFVLDEIVTYQNTVHRELNGLTPNQKWQQEAAQHGIVAPPPFTEAMRRKFWREYNGLRPLTDKGIRLFGMHYQSPELRQLPRFSPVAQYAVPRERQRIYYSLRFNPHDIHCIAVFDGANYVADAYANELRLPDGTYLSLSVTERELAKQFAHDNDSQDVGRDWLHYLDNLKATVRQRQAEMRAVHRSQTEQQVLSPVEIRPKTTGDDHWLDDTESALDTLWRD
jgi:hypothetical protein